MQTEKSQPEGKRIMPETRFTEGLGFLGLHRRTMIDYLSYLLLVVFERVFVYYFLKRYMTANSERQSEIFVMARKHLL